MATITEDYVSFETAKLLKEKGFNESCYTYYDDIDDSINRFDKGLHFSNTSYPWGVPYDISKAKKYVVAPTLQMTIKWLRKKHNILLFLLPAQENGKLVYLAEVWTWNEGEGIYESTYASMPRKEPEQTINAAIKHSLENLI